MSLFKPAKKKGKQKLTKRGLIWDPKRGTALQLAMNRKRTTVKRKK